MNKPLMPMATAVWLVDNTTLTFGQIARFCHLHELEVQAIADETIAQHIVGMDPTLNAQLTWAEIERCQKDDAADLVLLIDEVPATSRTKGPRYTPVSKRQDKPDAIAWLVRYHPELTDGQISKLIGTTKPTIQAIRDKSHWNISKITANDPVGLGLCSQIELDGIVAKAAAKLAKNNPQPAEDAEEATDEAKAEVKATPVFVEKPVVEEPKPIDEVSEPVAIEEDAPKGDSLASRSDLGALGEALKEAENVFGGGKKDKDE